MTEYHFYKPADGHGLPHDPLNAIIAPRPIGWISTVSADGTRNLAPYSFFNLINYRPPLIAFSSSGWKDSVANVKATGEFVWNLATKALAAQMNLSSASVGVDIDEFELAGLAALPSSIVKPDRVANSPVHFECRMTQLIRLKNKEAAELAQWLVIGEALAFTSIRTCLRTVSTKLPARAQSPAEVTQQIILRSLRTRNLQWSGLGDGRPPRRLKHVSNWADSGLSASERHDRKTSHSTNDPLADIAL